MARRSRLLRALAPAALLAVAPAPALAQESLLSGYGGPGVGEQVILGSELLGGGGGGGGGAGGSGNGASAGGGGAPGGLSLRAVAPAPAVSAAPPVTPVPRRSTRRRSTTSSGTARRPSSGGSPRVVAAPTPAPGAPVRLAYPATDGASALPLSRDDVLALAGAALLLVLVAVSTRRLTRWQPGAPQA